MAAPAAPALPPPSAPPGTRVWLGAPPSDTLQCAVCYDVFTQARAAAPEALRCAVTALTRRRCVCCALTR
jgi:hypothetical protein